MGETARIQDLKVTGTSEIIATGVFRIESFTGKEWRISHTYSYKGLTEKAKVKQAVQNMFDRLVNGGVSQPIRFSHEEVFETYSPDIDG